MNFACMKSVCTLGIGAWDCGEEYLEMGVQDLEDPVWEERKGVRVTRGGDNQICEVCRCDVVSL